MRLSTLASIAVLAASSAAIAQVASSPVEQKIPVTGNVAEDADTAGNTASANTAAGNDVAPAATTPTETKPEPRPHS